MQKKNFAYLFVHAIIIFSISNFVASPSSAQSSSVGHKQDKNHEEKVIDNKNDGKGIGGTGSPLNDLTSVEENQNTIGEFDYSFVPLPDLSGTGTSGTSGNPPGEDDESSNIAPQNAPQNNVELVSPEGETPQNDLVSDSIVPAMELPLENNTLDNLNVAPPELPTLPEELNTNVAPPELPTLPEELNTPEPPLELGGGFGDGLSGDAVPPPDIGM